MNIQRNVNEYMKNRTPEGRLTSFDYCYNYFQSFYEKGCTREIASTENMYMSCLNIGFYLASWGMLRGSSFLLSKSVKHYEKLVFFISNSNIRLWEIDVDGYTDVNIKLLKDCCWEIRKTLGEKDDCASDTLVTKIMLGVFGNVPALDNNFRKAFGFNSLTERSLRQMSDFYDEYLTEIDSINIRTLDFCTDKETTRIYPKIKIIDMVGWIEGQKVKI